MATLYEELENIDFKCPFCGRKHQNTTVFGPMMFHCIGIFLLDIAACNREILSRWHTKDERILAWSILGYYIAQNYLDRQIAPNTGLTPIDFKWVLDNIELPTPAQQADNLILYLSEHTQQLGQCIEIEYDSPQSGKKIQAWIGAVDRTNLLEILKELTNNKLLTHPQQPSAASWRTSLTIAGWNRAEELKKVNKQSTQAFMAMKFEQQQQQFIKDKLAPVIKKMGFDLKLLPDIVSTENLIDNKLRVAIKRSRFLICDLTHGNRGAYWEAGYAEGLGLPVIYICEKKILDAKQDIHFDVSHQEIYSWEDGNEESIQSFLSKISDKIYLVTQ